VKVAENKHLSQKALETGGMFFKYILVANKFPGRQQAPNPPDTFKRNVENLA